MSLTIDDSDPRVSYWPQDQWKTAENPNEFNSTVSFTTVADATVTITFSQALFVHVLGTIGSAEQGPPPRSLYSIDGGTPVVHVATPQTNVQYGQTFFQSSILAPGTHTLVITTVDDGPVYYFDYLFIIPDPLPFPVLPLTTSIIPTIDSNTVVLDTASVASSTTSSLSTSYTAISSSSSYSRMSIRSSRVSTIRPLSMMTSPSPTQAQVTNTIVTNNLSPSLIAGVVIGVLGLTLVFFIILCRLKMQLNRRTVMNTHGSSWTTHLPNQASSVVPFIPTTEAPLSYFGKHGDGRQPQPQARSEKTKGIGQYNRSSGL